MAKAPKLSKQQASAIAAKVFQPQTAPQLAEQPAKQVGSKPPATRSRQGPSPSAAARAMQSGYPKPKGLR